MTVHYSVQCGSFIPLKYHHFPAYKHSTTEGPQRESEWGIYVINYAPVYIQGNSIGIQTPAHSNLIGRSMTAPPPVLSPSSILPPLVVSLSSCYRKKNQPAFKKMLLFQFLKLFFIA